MNPWITADHGHVTIHDRDTGYRIAHILDMGGTCAIDVLEDLTPQRAYDLGAELVRWGCRKKAEQREATRVARGLPIGTIIKEDA